MENVAQLLEGLEQDQRRSENGFSTEMATTQEQIFAESNKLSQAVILGGWLQTHQPCLFGRLAARYGQIGFCVLSRDIETCHADHCAGLCRVLREGHLVETSASGRRRAAEMPDYASGFTRYYESLRLRRLSSKSRIF